MLDSRTPPKLFACFWIACWVTAAIATDEGQFVANQIDQAVYRHYHQDLLFTHLGDDRRAGSPQQGQARTNISSEFASFGLTVELHAFHMQGRDGVNVIATQTGTLDPDALFIIGAHYDSVGNPGADDNASGTAAIMEIARVLSQFETDYTIRYIAFDMEELGLLGSRAYVADHPAEDVRGMISMDMIAYRAGANRAHIYGTSASAPIKNALGSAVTEYGGGLEFVLHGSFSGSDHAPFESAGYEACLLIERYTVNPCYHRACDAVDTPDYLDYDYAIAMTRSVAGYLADHAGVHLCVGDFDGDGAVTTADVAVVLANYGNGGPNSPGDVDGDGDTDLGDLALLLSRYGTVCD